MFVYAHSCAGRVCQSILGNDTVYLYVSGKVCCWYFVSTIEGKRGVWCRKLFYNYAQLSANFISNITCLQYQTAPCGLSLKPVGGSLCNQEIVLSIEQVNERSLLAGLHS